METAKAWCGRTRRRWRTRGCSSRYTEIRAPIDGRTGNLLIHQGNVVKANDVGNPLVVINRVHPIYVAFSVPERSSSAIKRYRAAGALPVEAHAAGGRRARRARRRSPSSTTRWTPTTGTIQLKATFENTDNALWPGQFVDVALTLTTETGALVVPVAGGPDRPEGPYVFVVKPDLTVEARPVTPGAARRPRRS